MKDLIQQCLGKREPSDSCTDLYHSADIADFSDSFDKITVGIDSDSSEGLARNIYRDKSSPREASVWRSGFCKPFNPEYDPSSDNDGSPVLSVG